MGNAEERHVRMSMEHGKLVVRTGTTVVSMSCTVPVSSCRVEVVHTCKTENERVMLKKQRQCTYRFAKREVVAVQHVARAVLCGHAHHNRAMILREHFL